MRIKLRFYNKINDIIKRNLGKQMPTETKIRIHNVTVVIIFRCAAICVLEKTDT